MLIGFLILTTILVAVEPASVKREEYSGSSVSANNNPVYSPASTSGVSYGSNSNSGSSSGSSTSHGSNFYNSNLSNQFHGSSDHSASASSNNYQAQPNSQGNLYYYYYPVQDKGKESMIQGSSSNQYASAVTPQHGESNQHSMEGASPAQDLSYSAQDLSYSAQNMGQGMAQGLNDYSSQGSGNYDQTLSNLASQLQQYGIGSGSSGSAYNPAAPSYSGSASSFGTGSNYGIATDANANGYGVNAGSGSGSFPSSSSSGSSSPASGDGSNPYSTSGHLPPNYGPAGAAPYAQGNPYNPQSYPGYGNQAFGNFAAASGPHPSYEPATSGYRRYGIGSIIMPMLALAGLSLLIPTVTSLGTAATGRKKRSINGPKESALGVYVNRVERYYNLYKTAVEKEECMNRILCELGDAISNVRGKSAFFTVIEKVVPNWMGNKVAMLKNGALSSDYGKCKRFSCQ